MAAIPQLQIEEYDKDLGRRFFRKWYTR